MNWAEFFSMGGYGIYVWGSYGFTALVLVANIIAARHKKQKAVKILKQMMTLKQPK